MSAKQQVLDQLDSLIESGQKYDNSYSSSVDSMGAAFTNVPENELRAFATRSFAAIERIAGRASQYYEMLPDVAGSQSLQAAGYGQPVTAPILGSLLALRDAVDAGHLETLEAQIRALVHDDFLQQAKDLLASNYHVAAMVLAGGVLEDHLKKLCTTNGLTWNGSGSISKYNDACRQGNVYDQAKWRRIQSIGDLRNQAAHGQGGNVNSSDVDDACKFTERFISDFPA